MSALLPAEFIRPSRLRLLLSAARILAIVVALGLAYAFVPVTPNGETGNWVILAVGLLVFAAILMWQALAVLRSTRPIGRALEALCICLSVYLTMFALQYLAESLETTQAFTQPLDKLAAIYYTVTVFATVGFGDIAPVSNVARAMTTIQMIINLIVLGLGVRLLAGFAQERLKVQYAPRTDLEGPGV